MLLKWIALALFILWSIFGSRYYVCSIKQACDRPVKEVIEAKDYGPLVFNWSKSDPITGNGWLAYRDSLAALIKNGTKLEIIGNYYPTESDGINPDALGKLRADEIKSLFAGLIPDSLLSIKFTPFNHSSAQKTKPFPAFGFNVLKPGEKEPIVELEDRTLIYFPFSSSRKKADSKVDTYLQRVASEIKGTKKRIKLTGHSDYIGSHNVNWKLSERRAKNIRDILRSHGVPSDQILIEVKGETEPISSNDTESGRAENRRVELEILD